MDDKTKMVVFYKALAELILGKVLKIEERPEIEVGNFRAAYNSKTRTIYIPENAKMQTCEDIKILPHECYHFFETRNKTVEESSYSKEDVFRINKNKEWWIAFNYEFEINAIAFGHLFLTFFVREILGKKVMIPSELTNEEMILHPELREAFRKIEEKYLEMHTEYYLELIKYKNEIKVLYEHCFDR